MSLATLSFTVAALVYAVLLAKVLRASSFGESSALAQAVFVFGLTSTIAWSLAGATIAFFDTSALPQVLSATFDLVRYGAWLLLLLVLTRQAKTLAVVGSRRLLAGLLFFSVLTGLSCAVAIGAIGEKDGLRRLLWLGYLALPVAGLLLVEQLYRNLPEDFRWHAKPLCLGLACVFLFDIYLYSYATLFGDLDVASASVRPAIHTLAVPLMLVATNRHADWIRGLKVSRIAATHTATLTLVGVYLIVVSGIGYYIRVFGGTWGEALQLSVLCIALLGLAVILLSTSWRAKIKVAIAKNFYSYRYDYRAEWLQFTAMLASSTSPRQTGEMIIRGLAGMVQSPAGALWARAFNAEKLIQISRWNTAVSNEQESASSRFAARLLEEGWIVDLDEYRSSPDRYADWMIPDWLVVQERNWLVIPLPMASELVGFVVLQKPQVGPDLGWEVRDILKTASRQAASYLAQIHAAEALLEARKFDAFNRMSAFVVHDLKNIVTQLSLMMQNARRLHDNPEFRQDMLTTIENSLQKMRQLMLQLREGAVPMGASLGVELAPILKDVQTQAQMRGRAVELNIVQPLATRGHEDRVSRVVGHVVQNALDATTSGGEVSVILERAAGQARIVIADTGQGMTAEFISTKLFKPFTSTKTHGMGIGAYESLQYVESIGGKVMVDSEVGRGTVITLLLPLFDRSAVPEIEMMSEP